MRKRLIAAFVLAALACWNVPVALATPTNSQRPVSHASQAHDHSCCPGFHVQLTAPLFVVMPLSGMPCDNQHPCCAKQRPENSPALTSATRVERPKAKVEVAIAAENADQVMLAAARQGCGCKILPSYFVRSTVLRI